MRKYIITEDQQKHLINKKRTDKVVERITKEVNDSKLKLNEAIVINEAVN